MAFVIKTDVSRRIVAGSFKETEFHYVADEATGELVGKKAHDLKADAERELAGMSGLESGLEFAKAQFPDQSLKAQVGKANVIAEYLAWEAAGKPVKEAGEKSEEAAEEPAAAQPADEETF